MHEGRCCRLFVVADVVHGPPRHAVACSRVAERALVQSDVVVTPLLACDWLGPGRQLGRLHRGALLSIVVSVRFRVGVALLVLPAVGLLAFLAVGALQLLALLNNGAHVDIAARFVEERKEVLAVVLYPVLVVGGAEHKDQAVVVAHRRLYCCREPPGRLCHGLHLCLPAGAPCPPRVVGVGGPALRRRLPRSRRLVCGGPV
mmetsp:Transcript_11271/g.27501  ORF Transcript_11271/g.27501 Transcript_11271/m.27501 type:complete len:202 (+) Transcript_11271:4459-5064(+)